mmetsp:Transcript_7217/g.19333  ORF Transcript_7217/g.19333 Transcript_7217/m.19333 type:complete len:246 (-) Transcript_7217:20-757(-)
MHLIALIKSNLTVRIKNRLSTPHARSIAAHIDSSKIPYDASNQHNCLLFLLSSCPSTSSGLVALRPSWRSVHDQRVVGVLSDVHEQQEVRHPFRGTEKAIWPGNKPTSGAEFFPNGVSDESREREEPETLCGAEEAVRPGRQAAACARDLEDRAAHRRHCDPTQHKQRPLHRLELLLSAAWAARGHCSREPSRARSCTPCLNSDRARRPTRAATRAHSTRMRDRASARKAQHPKHPTLSTTAASL